MRHHGIRPVRIWATAITQNTQHICGSGIQLEYGLVPGYSGIDSNQMAERNRSVGYERKSQGYAQCGNYFRGVNITGILTS
jgi:hypothetical protein